MKKMMVIIMCFSLMCLTAHALEIVSPEERVYSTSVIPFVVASDTVFDSILYQINSGTIMMACENCNSVNQELVLDEGEYRLDVEGITADISVIESVIFSVFSIINLGLPLKSVPPPTTFSFSYTKLFFK